MTAKILPFSRPVRDEARREGPKGRLEVDELQGRILAKTHELLRTWKEIKRDLLEALDALPKAH